MDRNLERALALALFLLLGLIVYANRDILYRNLSYLRRQAAPCSAPVTYAAGAVDGRFGLSRSEFAAALLEAEEAWETASGRDLFAAASGKAALTVNLVYDEKQASGERLRAMGGRAAEGRAAVEGLLAQQEAMAAKAEADKAALLERAGNYRRRQQAYEAAARAAAPGSGEALRAEREGLEREYRELKAAEAELNSLADSVNSLGSHADRQVAEHNRKVDEVNREGAAAGDTEEGVYRSGGALETIDIYQYTDRRQLRRLLMHELGHAAGFAHVGDPLAVMHGLYTGQPPALTRADLDELARVCTKR